jgi:hypothetical protein
VIRKLLLAAFVIGLLQAPALAVGNLDQASFGEYWFGPERTPASLKGHIVLWENWGYN